MYKIIVDFLVSNCGVLLICVAIVLLVYFCLNIFGDPYRLVNSQIQLSIKTIKKICGKRCDITTFVAPQELSAQWKAYKKTVDCYPSEVFTFQSKKQSLRWLTPSLVSTLFSCVYLYLFFTKEGEQNNLFLTPIVFITVFVIVSCLCKLHQVLNAKSALKLFGAWVFLLDEVFGKSQSPIYSSPMEKSEISDATNKISILCKSGMTVENAEKLTSIITPEWLNKDRTVEQQRQLNIALNGLVNKLSQPQQ